MKQLALVSFLLAFIPVFGQKSEDLIPKDAVTVLSINNMSVFQKVSLDELIQYDFMIDIQQELFDGSTSGKSIKDAGIDFDQKLNVFYGRTYDYEISGFTFGIADEEKLFTVFDDFEQREINSTKVKLYTSYFNQLIITGKSALLIRLEPVHERIADMVDSLWYARGNDYYWGAYENDFMLDEEGMIDNVEENILEIEGEEIKNEQVVYGEQVDDSLEIVFEEERDIVSGKTYWELRDSISFALQANYTREVITNLFRSNGSLIASDERFASQLQSKADGIFYLDNSRNLEKNQSFWYMKTMFPLLYQDLTEFYQGNVVIGDIYLNEKDIRFHCTANYGERLGSIYQQLNDSKFDKNVLKYIPADNAAFFTYNIDLRKAYEQAYKVIVPILEKESGIQVSMNLMMLELLNEYVNKDALFNTYKGSMFGTFNGIKKVKTTKYTFQYDEDTFEYTEEEVEAEEDMPIFTLGLSTERGDIAEKILYRLSRATNQFEKVGDYWVYHDAILEAAPLYFMVKSKLLIVTNDEDLVMNNPNGFGAKAIGGKKAKEIKKNGFMYAEVDAGKTIDRLPRDMFNGEQNEIIDAMRGKGGYLKISSTKTTKKNTMFDAIYTFDGDYNNSSKYILDFVNSLYLISK